MARIKLDAQPHYEFQINQTVRITDINYGNHLDNAALVSFLHQARVDLFQQLGCRELDLGDGKTGIVVADLGVNFLGEGFLFDNILIECHVDDLTRKSFRIYYRLSCNNQPIALAETGILAFDYTIRKIAPLPTPFLEALAQHQP